MLYKNVCNFEYGWLVINGNDTAFLILIIDC